jgi:hypothetical protein
MGRFKELRSQALQCLHNSDPQGAAQIVTRHRCRGKEESDDLVHHFRVRNNLYHSVKRLYKTSSSYSEDVMQRFIEALPREMFEEKLAYNLRLAFEKKPVIPRSERQRIVRDACRILRKPVYELKDLWLLAKALAVVTGRRHHDICTASYRATGKRMILWENLSKGTRTKELPTLCPTRYIVRALDFFNLILSHPMGTR